MLQSTLAKSEGNKNEWVKILIDKKKTHEKKTLLWFGLSDTTFVWGFIFVLVQYFINSASVQLMSQYYRDQKYLDRVRRVAREIQHNKFLPNQYSLFCSMERNWKFNTWSVKSQCMKCLYATFFKVIKVLSKESSISQHSFPTDL